jgi:hypothetical protein
MTKGDRLARLVDLLEEAFTLADKLELLWLAAAINRLQKGVLVMIREHQERES